MTPFQTFFLYFCVGYCVTHFIISIYQKIKGE